MDLKTCTRCNKKLPIDQFERYSGERGKTNLRSSRTSHCKKCRSETRLRNLLRKKIYIITTIFHGKCCECDTGIEFLPSLEFHHLFPKLKTTVWTHIKHSSLTNIEKWITNEKVIVLCSNCHEMKKEKYFNDFQNLILKEDLFDYTSEEIDELINNAINSHRKYSDLGNYKRNIKIQIKKYIRKRFVLSKLFGGKCVGCNKKILVKLLPVLELHHLSPNNATIKSNWADIANFHCNSIISQIIKEKSICLCSNCHILVRSKLINYIEDVFKKPISRANFANNYNTIISNIKSFNYPMNQVEISPPLKLKFSQDDFWKLHFMQISIIMKRNKRWDFKVSDLANLLDQDQRSVRYYLDRLISLKVLEKIQEHTWPFENLYIITDHGLKILEELKDFHKKSYEDLKNDLFCMNNYMKRQNRWTK